MPLTVSEVIKQLELEPLPLEGGYFRRSYLSPEEIDLEKGYKQPLFTCIYFLLTPDAFSALHWLREDEIYHYYLGDPVELCEIGGTGKSCQTILGHDINNGHQVQHTVYKNRWQGSRLVKGGSWALLGTTMAPGFTWEDFTLGDRDELLNKFPQHRDIILNLTRKTDGLS